MRVVWELEAGSDAWRKLNDDERQRLCAWLDTQGQPHRDVVRAQITADGDGMIRCDVYALDTEGHLRIEGNDAVTYETWTPLKSWPPVKLPT